MSQELPNETTSGATNEGSREQRYNQFVGFLAIHDQAIRRFIRALMPSRDGVDDVLQETALECWKKFDDFSPADKADPAEEFIRWACVIARFKVLSHFRDRSRDRLCFRESLVDRLAETALSQIGVEESERIAVDDCLSQLSEDQRRLVLSVHSPGESVARIASETGVRARTLYSKVNSLRRILLDCVRSKLAAEGSHG